MQNFTHHTVAEPSAIFTVASVETPFALPFDTERIDQETLLFYLALHEQAEQEPPNLEPYNIQDFDMLEPTLSETLISAYLAIIKPNEFTNEVGLNINEQYYNNKILSLFLTLAGENYKDLSEAFNFMRKEIISPNGFIETSLQRVSIQQNSLPLPHEMTKNLHSIHEILDLKMRTLVTLITTLKPFQVFIPNPDRANRSIPDFYIALSKGTRFHIKVYSAIKAQRRPSNPSELLRVKLRPDRIENFNYFAVHPTKAKYLKRKLEREKTTIRKLRRQSNTKSTQFSEARRQ